MAKMTKKKMSIEMDVETGEITKVTPLFTPSDQGEGPVTKLELRIIDQKGKKYKIRSVSDFAVIGTEPGATCRWVFSGGRYRYV